MSSFFHTTDANGIDPAASARFLDELIATLKTARRVLLVPPDFTRLHSGAGLLTSYLYKALSSAARVMVMPALGTHAAMSARERDVMYPGIPESAFLTHDFRRGVSPLGEVPAKLVREVSGGLADFPIRAELATPLLAGAWDRIISLGQVVPHEVAGMAGHAKNVFIGLGGKDVIDRTHFVGALCGMERAMGTLDTPVRALLDYIATELGAALPLTYVLTVQSAEPGGGVRTRGLFAGDDRVCLEHAARLAFAHNVELLDEAPQKIVVYLDPSEFRSTWLGNKAIYRTRLAIADGGELLVLAPGVACMSSDPAIDALVRRYGYHGSAATLAAVERAPELADSLAVAAHLIHGSSEGRFRVRYAAGGLSADEIRNVGYEAAELAAELTRYEPAKLRDGFGKLADGERFFYVSRPGLGLWAERARIARIWGENAS